MWEVRKQIIELIEPYMDKTLSVKWCLLKYIPDDYIHEYNVNNFDIFKEWFDAWDIKILGHYDITAVFRYIENFRYKYLQNWNKDFLNQRYNLVISDDEWYIDSDLEKMWSFIEETEFKLKPLHLYTEQEEKDLLNILVNLK